MLRNASGVSRDYGTRNEDIVVIDQDGILRLKTTAIATGSHLQVNDMVDALINRSPVISLSLRQIYFGRILKVGESKTVELKIENTGAGALEITGYEAPEGVTVAPSALTIGVNESKTVQITLTPTQPGTFSGHITFQHSDQSVGTLQIPLSELTIEVGQIPSIALIQESLSLGEIEVSKPTEKIFTIANQGTGPLTITDIRSDMAGIALSETQFTVPAGQSQDITVIFLPRAEGPISGRIDVFSDDPENAVVRLSITGSAIFIPVDPRADFDNSGEIDFQDFLLFVQAFGTANPTFDLNGSGSVDFPDFLTFVANFGKSVD